MVTFLSFFLFIRCTLNFGHGPIYCLAGRSRQTGRSTQSTCCLAARKLFPPERSTQSNRASFCRPSTRLRQHFTTFATTVVAADRSPRPLGQAKRSPSPVALLSLPGAHTPPAPRTVPPRTARKPTRHGLSRRWVSAGRAHPDAAVVRVYVGW